MNAKTGDRIELTRPMIGDPFPVPVGTRGWVTAVRAVDLSTGGFVQIDVAWDGGRTLMLAVPPDEYVVLTETEQGEGVAGDNG